MTELERALVRLGDELAFPAAPDVSAHVLARLAAPPPRRRRRALVLVLAVLALAVGAAMAVPQARTAILELFRLRGATVERVETLPPVPPVDPLSARMLELGTSIPVSDLETGSVLVPAALGTPNAVYVSTTVPGRVSLVYEPGPGAPRSPFTDVGILVTQFPARLDTEEYISKLAAGGTEIERVTVDGSPGLWLEDGPHFVFFRTPDGRLTEDSARLASNTLLVEMEGMLVRIEGELSRERAVEIAESLE